mmetsp:Transcript_55596/g.132519  ORF Transcript_55596/g.132519 Transcript_55596/m.132519 type:complete len:87 (+) Transcript_55596:622-882(+)
MRRERVTKLQSASGATGGKFMALLEKERKALLEMDRFFVLELAFMECMHAWWAVAAWLVSRVSSWTPFQLNEGGGEECEGHIACRR